VGQSHGRLGRSALADLSALTHHVKGKTPTGKTLARPGFDYTQLFIQNSAVALFW